MNDLKTITILFRAVNTMEKLIRDDVFKYGLNVSEFGVLEALYHKGNLSLKGVIDKVLIPNSSMSYVIDNLVKKNYIIKNQSEKDRRSFMLELSNQGKDLMDKVFIQHQENLRNVLDVLTENEERALQKSLIKIGKRAKTINET